MRDASGEINYSNFKFIPDVIFYDIYQKIYKSIYHFLTCYHLSYGLFFCGFNNKG